MADKLRIFLASPGDVSRERQHVMRTVDEVNLTVAAERNMTLEVVSWTTDSLPGYGADAQELINAQIAEMSQYALFVGIMWNRLGTATPRAGSGTVEEFDRAASALREHGRPDIWFYFRDAAARLETKSALAQKKKVLTFRSHVQRHGLPFEYKTVAGFRDLFRQHLLMWVIGRVGSSRAVAVGDRSSDPALIFMKGPLAGQSYPIGPGRTLQIGRDPSSTIRFVEATLSRTHAVIERTSDGCVLQDSSAAGTFVNGTETTSRRLEDGDMISFGGVTVARFRAADPHPDATGVEARVLMTGGSLQEPVIEAALVEPEISLYGVCGSTDPRHGTVPAQLATEVVADFIRRSSGEPEMTWPFGIEASLSFNGNRLRTAALLVRRRLSRLADRDELRGARVSIAAALVDAAGLSLVAVGVASCVWLRRGAPPVVVPGPGTWNETETTLFEEKGLRAADVILFGTPAIAAHATDLSTVLARGGWPRTVEEAASRIDEGTRTLNIEQGRCLLLMWAV